LCPLTASLFPSEWQYHLVEFSFLHPRGFFTIRLLLTPWPPLRLLPRADSEFCVSERAETRKFSCKLKFKLLQIILTDLPIVLWRIDPLLSSDSVISSRCYATSVTYTHATTEERRFPCDPYQQRRGKHASTTIEGLCFLRGPCRAVILKISGVIVQ
jgi:hypothetical protein